MKGLTVAPVTMSSREIAELTGKRHDNVMRTIETLHERAAIGLPHFEEVPNHGPGPLLLKQYRVGKRDSYVIVAQLSPEFTAALVDRWQELEAAQAPRLPQNFAEALRLAADQAEQIEQQRAIIHEQAPKAEFVDRYVEGTGLKGFRQVCKLLKAKENEFREFLKIKNIMYQLGGEWVPYAAHVDAGRFSVKTGQADNGHNFNAAKFTPKGVQWIAGVWAQYSLVQGIAQQEPV